MCLVNANVSFRSPLQFEKLGLSRPLINLPVSLVYSAGRAHTSLLQMKRCDNERTTNTDIRGFLPSPAILVEYLHMFLRPVMEVPLLFTRSEVMTPISKKK